MKIKNLLILGTVAVAFFATFMILLPKESQAVRVSLKRVIFQGNKKSEIITIINNSPEEQTYRLGWRRYRMDTDKSLRAINEGEDDSDILWADDMIKFAPRRVQIAPGQAQQVRLLFRRPKDLAEAEYRSHLWIVTEAKPDQFDALKSDPSKQAIRLAVQPAISLPVFVRNGNLNATTSITNARLYKENNMMKVGMTLNREGNRSVYGDFDFTCIEGGRNLLIRKIRGISVYTEISHRNLNFELPMDELEISSCSQVAIQYRADPDDPTFKGATLATATASF